jgi:hypothetical protein
MPWVLPVTLAALALVLAGGLWWWKRRSASGRA